MELLRVNNVTKTYHVGEIDVPVLKGVSFSIQQGEIVTLMGTSGSGKSTLMNILGCLDRPTSGEYWLNGKEVGHLAPDERALVRTDNLGFVFQSFNLLARTTAVNNVLMPLEYSSKPPATQAALQRAHRLLERVGLQDRLDHVPSQMSGGQQQRVAIARSLINEPALLLADEPTGNLDSKTSVEILEMFQQLNAAGITVILVTHDPKVATYAHRTIRVVDGLIQEDTGNRALHVPLIQPRRRDDEAGGEVSTLRPQPPTEENETWQASEPVSTSHGGEQSSTLVMEPATQTAVLPEAKHVHLPEKTSEVPKISFGEKLYAWLPSPLRTSIGALRRNKMRSALTTIGIIIGVASVIAMVEISQGSKKALEATMSTMGANNLLIQSGAASSGGISFGLGSEKTLTPTDAAEIRSQCPAVSAVAPIVQISGQVINGNKNWVPMMIYGTTPDYLKVRDWGHMEAGDMFTERDVLGAIKVCVIGTTLARELFGDVSPIGKDIRVQNVALKVVGVLGRKGANMMGMDQDDLVLAPWTTIKFRVSGNNTGGASKGSTAGTTSSSANEVNSLSDLYPGRTSMYIEQTTTQTANNPQPVRFINVDSIQAKAATAGEIPEAMAQITALLSERHNIREHQDPDFNIRDMSEIIKALSQMSGMMGGLLLIVALISLVVGGVGIMNIMLVSVTERTREIGLRMAVGARGYHILRQFLIEAVVLCLFGGLIGIAFGRSVAILVWYFLRWPIAASWPTIAIAFCVSAIVGIAFGFYPAWKASRLDPIEALRYE